MIPESLRGVVERALEAAFGTTALAEVTLLPGGMRSALACRIVVAGTPYLLRIGSSLVDPTYELACTRAAAEAGLAPRVHYADAQTRVLIADYVPPAARPADFASRIATTLGRVHALPPWSRTIHQLDTADRFVGLMRDARVRADADDVLAPYAELATVYPRHSDLVACHNDVKPQNVLFDGARVWLVDWEAAFNNDRYGDLAIVANFFADEESAEESYLTAYFGTPPTEYQRARFFLARCGLHVSYMALLSLLAARGGVTAQPTPDFHAFHTGLIAGSIELHSAEAKLQYANAHLAAARARFTSARFAAALAVLR